MLLQDLFSDIKYYYMKGECRVDITGIAYDSREVRAGNIFVCIVGLKTDGHKYIDSATKNGAAAVVTCCTLTGEILDKTYQQRVTIIDVRNSRECLALLVNKFYNYPARQFKLIGVTGTNGKTSVTYLIKEILEHAGKKVGLIGTIQNMIGNKVLPSERTTPESLELVRLFRDMADDGVEYVVMEVSSHSLALGRVYGQHFDVGVFTNITQDHLDFHYSMDDYLKAKMLLFKNCDAAIINTDCRYSDYILKNSSTMAMYTIAIENDALFKANDIHLYERGVKFNLAVDQNINQPNCFENGWPGNIIPIKLGIPGKFSVYNALAAIGVCSTLGINACHIIDALAATTGVRGRAQIIPANCDFTILIDYAHTPDGLQNILSTVRGFAKGRVVTVFGCGGDRDKTKRPIMGNIAQRYSDFCIVTSDNPRSENPANIIKDIEEGMSGNDYTVIENRLEAITYSIENALPNDVIVLAGKGHETYQILADKTIHFDEQEIVQNILVQNGIDIL